MRVRIHRGAQQIGGSCIELAADGARLLLDLGLPLGGDPADSALHPALTDGSAPGPLAGLVLTHGHRDHVGLAHLVEASVPVAMGAAARRILAAAAPFVPGPAPAWITAAGDTALDLTEGVPLRLGPFTVTPHLVDHSGFDAYALTVAAGEHRLFYSGDLRAHGRKGALFERLLRHPPTNIDAMLMEGSSFGRLDPGHAFPTEAEIESDLADALHRIDGLALVAASAQNIDRVVSLYLVRQRQGAADLSADGAFALDPDQALWRHYAGPQTLGEMLRAAAHLAGPEKDGVHDLVLASPRVVDVEISLSAAAPQAIGADEALGGGDPMADSKASRQDRIDVATLTEREGKAFVCFHEAKHFTNPELRAGPTRKPPVVAQIERYRATLTHHTSQLSLSYQAVARALVRLDRLRQEVTGPGTPSRLDPLVIRVAEDPVPPAIDTEPRLVVFGFDEDQRDGTVWGRHRTRLTEEFGLQVYAVGSTRGRRHAAFR